MALALRRQYGFRKRIGSVSKQAAVPVSNALVTGIVIAGNDLVVTFDQPVILLGFPASWSQVGGGGAGNPVISAVLTSEAVVTLTFIAATIGALGLAVTPYDAAVRTRTGGYASPDAFTI